MGLTAPGAQSTLALGSELTQGVRCAKLLITGMNECGCDFLQYDWALGKKGDGSKPIKKLTRGVDGILSSTREPTGSRRESCLPRVPPTNSARSSSAIAVRDCFKKFEFYYIGPVASPACGRRSYFSHPYLKIKFDERYFNLIYKLNFIS